MWLLELVWAGEATRCLVHHVSVTGRRVYDLLVGAGRVGGVAVLCARYVEVLRRLRHLLLHVIIQGGRRHL